MLSSFNRDGLGSPCACFTVSQILLRRSECRVSSPVGEDPRSSSRFVLDRGACGGAVDRCPVLARTSTVGTSNRRMPSGLVCGLLRCFCPTFLQVGLHLFGEPCLERLASKRPRGRTVNWKGFRGGMSGLMRRVRLRCSASGSTAQLLASMEAEFPRTALEEC